MLLLCTIFKLWLAFFDVYANAKAKEPPEIKASSHSVDVLSQTWAAAAD